MATPKPIVSQTHPMKFYLQYYNTSTDTILFCLVEISENYVCEGTALSPIALRARVVSYALEEYKVFFFFLEQIVYLF